MATAEQTKKKLFSIDRQTIYRYLTEDLSLPLAGIASTVTLLVEGGTVPFIARYRKEQTGGLTETQIRQIQEKLYYYTDLEQRKSVVLDSIEEQGKLTEELKGQITACRQQQRLEDLYLPFKPKRRTKATLAREQGLEGLAGILLEQPAIDDPAEELERFILPEKGIADAAAALAGAGDIVTERIVEDADIRQWVRGFVAENGVVVTRARDEWKDKRSKFDMYYSFREKLKLSAAHRLLAIRRGVAEDVLSKTIEVDTDAVIIYLKQRFIREHRFVFLETLLVALKHAAERLIISAGVDVFCARMQEAETEAIQVFSKNLCNLLLESPAGHTVILGVDPGFRTGCKLAVIDEYGHFKAHQTMFPHPPQEDRRAAAETLLGMIDAHRVSLIAIGNGTASRETSQFVRQTLKQSGRAAVTVVEVSEAGASVYSASEVALREFPNLDVTVRGAISIARRLQDPLAELVKIDPKAIGVGQYQHDVNQVALKRSLDAVVESCVNFVGVELNTASRELLTAVAGIGSYVAKNIVEYRQQKGPFSTRQDLLKVPLVGPKIFEQAAGFLRIRNSSFVLDNSAIHPERYALIERMAADAGVRLEHLIGNKDAIRRIRPQQYVSSDVGLPTLQDILKELQKPGLDPRQTFTVVSFREDITAIGDLEPEMELSGKVTNVTNFGAFVDIGVHQDGLIHISKLSREFVTDPHAVVSVGDTVRVKVLAIDTELNRISLERIA